MHIGSWLRTLGCSKSSCRSSSQQVQLRCSNSVLQSQPQPTPQQPAVRSHPCIYPLHYCLPITPATLSTSYPLACLPASSPAVFFSFLPSPLLLPVPRLPTPDQGSAADNAFPYSPAAVFSPAVCFHPSSNQIKGALLTWLQRDCTSESPALPPFLRNKLAQAIVAVICSKSIFHAAVNCTGSSTSGTVPCAAWLQRLASPHLVMPGCIA